MCRVPSRTSSPNSLTKGSQQIAEHLAVSIETLQQLAVQEPPVRPVSTLAWQFGVPWCSSTSLAGAQQLQRFPSLAAVIATFLGRCMQKG